MSRGLRSVGGEPFPFNYIIPSTQLDSNRQYWHFLSTCLSLSHPPCNSIRIFDGRGLTRALATIGSIDGNYRVQIRRTTSQKQERPDFLMSLGHCGAHFVLHRTEQLIAAALLLLRAP